MRSLLALVCLVAGAVCAVVAGLLVSLVCGLFVAGGVLFVLGVLLGLDADSERWPG